MRTGTIQIGGREYILCFSAWVVRECAERYGTIGQIDRALTEGTETEMMDECVWLLERMMQAGSKYAEKIGIEHPKPLSGEDIYDLCGLDDLFGMKESLFRTIENGNGRKIEVEEAADGKNTAAAQPDGIRLSGISGMA